MTNRTCVICAKAMESEAMACRPCGNKLDSTLVDIQTLHAELPAQMERGQSNGQRVSGSREAPLPLRVDPLDLSMPARGGSVVDDVVQQYDVVQSVVKHTYLLAEAQPMYVTDEVHVWQKRPKTEEVDGKIKPVLGPAGDQIGYQSVLTLLDSWVRDWRETRAKSEHLPLPAGPSMITWLRNRLAWACQEHPAVDAFDQEMRELRSALRKVCGASEVKPELLDVPCRRCDGLDLHRLPGEDRVECGSCGLRLTEDEYRIWVGLVWAAAGRGEYDTEPE